MKWSPLLSSRWAIVLLLGIPFQAQAQAERFASLETEQMASPYISARAQAAQIPILDRGIAVDLEETPLEQALGQIAARTGLRLTYSTDLLPDDYRISLHASRITAADAVLRVLRGTSLDLLVAPSGDAVVVTRFEAVVPVVRQSATISGQVTDALSGQPLSGVAVAVMDLRRSVMTGPDGRYSIANATPGTHQLRVSMIGYAAQTQSVTVSAGQGAVANFALQAQAISLEGVVAVGYGTQKAKDVTGAVVSIDPDRLKNVPSTNVAQALEGSAPGVSVTTASAGAEPSFNIMIRGQSSITASNAPLIVVDGIPYNGTLSEINQNDVASINILKDASASAIYGARGANGVVLITTKKGRVGPAVLTYEGNVGMQELANLPRLMNGAEFADFKCQRIIDFSSCDETLTKSEKANLDAGRFTDWLDLATHRGFQQQHTLSVAGGAEGTRYYVSGAVLDTKGVAINDRFQRYTIRANLDQKVKSWLNVGINTQLSQSDRSGMPANFGSAFQANPLNTAYRDDGTLEIFPWPEYPETGNPLENLLVADDDVGRRVIASGFGEAKLPFLDGLSFRINGGVDALSRDIGRYYGRNTSAGLNNQGRATTTAERDFDWTVENILRYSRGFGKHNIDVTALYGAQGTSFKRSSLDSEGFPNDVLTYWQANVARSVVPSYGVQESGIISQMGRLNYGYDDRYLVTLTARRDGFSGFGSNNKYGTFPSLALAWNVSNEGFWNSNTFNDLKLRLSYGENGNSSVRPYQTLASFQEKSYLADDGSTWPGFIPSTLGNPNLRWETTTSLNGGLDFGLFMNRLRGSLDVYSSHTDDLLLNRLISPVHGISRILENIGSVRNRGVELALSGIPVETARFSWNADFTISANRGRILDLYGNGTDDPENGWFIGHSINTNYGYEFAGVWQETDDIANSAQPTARPGDPRVRDVNGDGAITPDDRTFLGTEDPSYTAGLSNTFRYGNLTLNVFLHTVQGVTRYNEMLLDAPINLDDGAARTNALLFNYWTPSNPVDTRWANRQGNNPFLVGLYQDASFIRLRDMTLSYDLPSAVLDAVGAGALRVYASGRNLWTHTKWTGLDPELSAQRATPLERVISIGITAGF